MEELDLFTRVLSQNNATQNDYIAVLINFILCVVMSFILRTFYVKRSFSLTGKMHIGSIIPILATVVFLVIMVVKSSLALSLGLVGALSIVRFRTPIKEPEELVYLFLAIAIGLGYAAGQTVLTTVIFLSILIINYYWLSNYNITQSIEYNLVISWSNEKISFEKVTEIISNSTDSIKLIRLEYGKDSNTAVLLIAPKKSSHIEELSKGLISLDKNLTVSFYEAKANW
tara:strand:- start:3370 stop:4053 length:684 start_codon:yes stop_codon:yes gene_type:complete